MILIQTFFVIFWCKPKHAFLVGHWITHLGGIYTWCKCLTLLRDFPWTIMLGLVSYQWPLWNVNCLFPIFCSTFLFQSRLYVWGWYHCLLLLWPFPFFASEKNVRLPFWWSLCFGCSEYPAVCLALDRDNGGSVVETGWNLCISGLPPKKAFFEFYQYAHVRSEMVCTLYHVIDIYGTLLIYDMCWFVLCCGRVHVCTLPPCVKGLEVGFQRAGLLEPQNPQNHGKLLGSLQWLQF